jgi:hypothetical protein
MVIDQIMKKRMFLLFQSPGNVSKFFYLFLSLLLSTNISLHAQVIIAQDNAAGYGGNWTNDSNVGFGFEAWNLNSSPGSGFAGWFLGNPSDAGISGLSDPSFGLFANPEGSGAFINADRNFFQPLPVGATFSFQWGVNWDSNGTGNKGINIYSGGTGGTQLININMGGSAAITINGDAMFNNYGTQSMTLHFELLSETQLRIYGTGRDGVETYDNTFTVSGVPDAVRFYASNLASGDNRQPYFNNLQIAFPENAILTNDLTVDGIIIMEDSSLDLNGNTLTLAEDGFFENNGAFSHGNGSVILKNTAEIQGSSQSHFYIAVVDGNDISFGPYTDGIPQSSILNTLEIQSGFIKANGAPEFQEGSTLFYRSNGNYQRTEEWNNPWNVRIGFETNLDLNINAWGDDITIRGNLIIDENSSLTIDDGAESHDLIIEGDLFLNGTLTLSGSGGRDLQIKGNWNRTGNFEHNQREVIFNGNGIQNINDQTTFSFIRINNPGGEVILQNDIIVNDRMEVDPGAMLNLQDRIVSGTGTFELMENGGLKIGHSEGITQSSDQGNIQVTGGRIYNPTATYHYIGNGDQFSGNGLPHNEAPKIITIELADDEATFGINTGFEILISSPGYFEIRRGVVVESTSFSVGRSVSGNGGLIISGGEYRFERPISELVPRLTGDYELTGGLIHLASEGNQSLRGGKPYHNLTFSGSGVVTASATPNISGTVTIRGEKILDLGNSTFGGSGTNLVMRDDSRLISSATGTFPAMAGSYDLTGGTIEFANNSVTNQTVRSPRNYYNIDITGYNVQNGAGNINILPTGTFSIKNGGRFQISSERYVTGDGHFNLEPGGTLRYAHVNGISLPDCGISAGCGNIRTFTRQFSPDAFYELYGSVNNQSTGNGLPASVTGLKIDKQNSTAQVTLTNPLTITGTDSGALNLNQGRLITNSNELIVTHPAPDAILPGPANTADFENSYITGVLTRKVGADQDDFIFPVGTADFVEVARINFGQLTGTNPVLSVSFTADNPSAEDVFITDLGLEIDGTVLNERLDYGFWTFYQQGMDSFQADLTITSRGHSNGGARPETHAVIRRNNNDSDWEIPVPGLHDNITQSGSGLDPITVVVSQINLFSDFAIGYSEFGPLPVEWLNFDAVLIGESIKLHWQTATEINNNYFTVLRSHNGLDFYPIAQIPGAGNSNEILSYTYTDNMPYEGVNYYKLRQTDFDGTKDYSQILAVKMERAIEPYIFYSKGNIHIQLPQSSKEEYEIRIHNIHGHILRSELINTLQGGSYHTINVSDLPKQILLIMLKSRFQLFTEKVVTGN